MEAAAAAAETKRRPEIDGLRAVAVSAVIIHHVSDKALPSGFLGVDMFFVISGFVITKSLVEQQHASLSALLAHFYCRRVKRLVPALVVCVLVTAYIGALFISPDSSEFKKIMNSGVWSLFGFSNILFSYEARDYFGTAMALNLFTHTWSLGVEEQFYFIIPLVVFATFATSSVAVMRRNLFWILLVLGVASLAYFFIYFDTHVSAFYLLPARFWELALGCLIALSPSLNQQPESCPAQKSFCTALASVVIAACLFLPIEWRLLTIPLVAAATATLIVALAPRQPIFAALNYRVIVLVGMMSYSLYLWHWSVLTLGRWTIGVTPHTVPALLLAMLTLATLSYVLIERPFRHRRWSSSDGGTIAIAGILIVGSAGLIAGLKSNKIGTLFLGKPAAMIAKGVATLKDDKWPLGTSAPIWRANDCYLTAEHDVGKTITTQSCSFGADPTRVQRRHLVIGNSYSAAAFEMYTDLATNWRDVVTVTSSWGASPVPEIPNLSPWTKANSYYWASVVPSLIKQLSPGDVVIMMNDIAELMPQVATASSIHKQNLLKQGLDRFARELSHRGISIIFVAPLPFLRDAGCTPDSAQPQWFHAGPAPACKFFTRDETTARRAPIVALLNSLQAAHQNFRVLDLLSVYCPKLTCDWFSVDDIPLYRDIYSHPSIEANILARPLLMATLASQLEN